MYYINKGLKTVDIMVFSINFDYEQNIIEWHNISEFIFKPLNIEKKMSFDNSDIPSYFKHFGIDILLPIDNGEDFVFKYSTGLIFSRTNHEEVIGEYTTGYSFGDILPRIKDFFYTTFKRVNSTGKEETIIAYIYDQGEIKEYFELIVTKDQEYILVIVKEETEKYLEKRLTDVAFNQSPHIKTILQDGKIVKINEVHQKLFGHTLEDIKDVTIDDLDQKYPVLFNDTGLALSFKQIYNLVLSNQYPHIFYRSFLYIPSYEDYLVQ